MNCLLSPLPLLLPSFSRGREQKKSMRSYRMRPRKRERKKTEQKQQARDYCFGPLSLEKENLVQQEKKTKKRRWGAVKEEGGVGQFREPGARRERNKHRERRQAYVHAICLPGWIRSVSSDEKVPDIDGRRMTVGRESDYSSPCIVSRKDSTALLLFFSFNPPW